MSFVPVEAAINSFGLETGDKWGVCHYPREKDVWQLTKDSIIAQHLRKASTKGLAVVTGPPGTGKTFRLLLLGHEWKLKNAKQVRWPSTRPQRLSFYAPLLRLTTEEVIQQWQAHEGDECLWLVDDAHADLGFTKELVDAYQELELGDRGHCLLLAGWTVPRSVRTADSVAFLLTPDLIHAALVFVGHRVPEREVLNALASPAVGLRACFENTLI